jgi:hypothetical protein
MRALFGVGLGAFVALAGAASGASAPTLATGQHVAGLAAVTYGATIKLSGHESAGGSRPVALQADAFPFTGGFHTVASRVTTGPYSFTVKPSHATRYRAMVGGRTSPVLTVYVLERRVSSSCNLCVFSDTSGTHTLVVSATLEAPPGPLAATGPEYFYYAQTNSTAPPSTLRLVKTVPLHVHGHRLSFKVVYTVHFPLGAFRFSYEACSRDAESADGVGLPGHHHCGDATIKRGAEYLG